MSNTLEGRMSPLGAGLRRIWAELEIMQGRIVNSSTLAAEARASTGKPVQAATPFGIVLGRDTYSPDELARILQHLGVTLEEAEQIGSGRFDMLEAWIAGGGTLVDN